MLYNIVLVSTVQQSEPATYTRIPSFLYFLPITTTLKGSIAVKFRSSFKSILLSGLFSDLQATCVLFFQPNVALFCLVILDLDSGRVNDQKRC